MENGICVYVTYTKHKQIHTCLWCTVYMHRRTLKRVVVDRTMVIEYDLVISSEQHVHLLHIPNTASLPHSVAYGHAHKTHTYLIYEYVSASERQRLSKREATHASHIASARHVHCGKYKFSHIISCKTHLGTSENYG